MTLGSPVGGSVSSSGKVEGLWESALEPYTLIPPLYTTSLQSLNLASKYYWGLPQLYHGYLFSGYPAVQNNIIYAKFSGAPPV